MAVMRRYYLTGYMRVDASSEQEATDKAAAVCGSDGEFEIIDGVTICFDGPWDEVVDLDDDGECVCPPDLLARGGFKGGCPVHA